MIIWVTGLRYCFEKLISQERWIWMGINKMRGIGTPLSLLVIFDQELMEIAKHWQIDQETGRRL